jgi:purine catabolism regulator
VLGSSVVVLTAVDPDVQSALRRSDGQQLRLGVSRGVTLDDLQRGVAEAERALAAATVRDLRIARYDELAAEGLLGLVDERDALEFARSRLAPLRAYQESSGIDLVETLRAYLTANGQWDRAATELGVHRHTLRYRMRKVTQLLDVSVDTPQARMDLWFALSCVPAHNRTPPIL